MVRRGSDVIELTKREYELLLTLMENVNVVLARDVLLNKVWGYETEVETNVVDVYIRYLRNKIDVPGEKAISKLFGDRIRDAFVSLKKNEKLKELKGPSLTVKWAFASSFFILLFYNFAVITYKTSINLLVAKEENNVERTMSEVASRLANSDQELTLVRTYRNLTKNDSGDTSIYDRTSTIDGNLMKIDSFISELGQSPLSLFVYNLNQELIFKTHENNLSLIDVQRKPPTIVTLDNITGFCRSSQSTQKKREKNWLCSNIL